MRTRPLLTHAYPMDLYTLMAVNWPKFGAPLLGPDKQAWSVKFGVLSKVRTPLAHNRDISPSERTGANSVWREILEKYDAFLKSQA